MTDEQMEQMIESFLERYMLEYWESQKGQETIERFMMRFQDMMTRRMQACLEKQMITKEESKPKGYMTREEFLSLSEADEEYIEKDASIATDFYEYRPRAMESRLKKKGYSVAQNSGLTNYQRQQLLKKWIEEGEFTKWEIIYHLKYLIRTNGQSKKNEVAVIKWNLDINFVQNL